MQASRHAGIQARRHARMNAGVQARRFRARARSGSSRPYPIPITSCRRVGAELSHGASEAQVDHLAANRVFPRCQRSPKE